LTTASLSLVTMRVILLTLYSDYLRTYGQAKN